MVPVIVHIDRAHIDPAMRPVARRLISIECDCKCMTDRRRLLCFSIEHLTPIERKNSLSRSQIDSCITKECKLLLARSRRIVVYISCCGEWPCRSGVFRTPDGDPYGEQKEHDALCYHIYE